MHSASNEDDAYPYKLFFQNTENPNQNASPSLNQTLDYQPRVLELPILLNQVSHKGPN